MAGSLLLAEMSTVVFRSQAYATQTSYDDACNVFSQTYPDGQTVANSFVAHGWLSNVSTSQGGTTLASNLAYAGNGRRIRRDHRRLARERDLHVQRDLRPARRT